ncbi:MAG: phytanoyl-CoA dioxygenase family protein [Opitutales bacterium]
MAFSPPSIELSSGGRPLDASPDALGAMEEATHLLGDPEALREQLAETGYLLIRGFHDRDRVVAARRSILQKLADADWVDPDGPLEAGRLLPDAEKPAGLLEYAYEEPAVENVIYGPAMMALMDALLGGPAMHFDYTWLRTTPPGNGTPPHCDLVFMGRGTHHLFTCWTPLGDIDYEQGGLMVLEDSHRKRNRIAGYLKGDFDSFCANRPEAEIDRSERAHAGHLTDNPVRLRQSLGGRWLTTEFRMGDILIFPMYLIHASLDNTSEDRVRLSTDSRYQLATEAVDPRWVRPAPGERPPGHGPHVARGVIC